MNDWMNDLSMGMGWVQFVQSGFIQIWYNDLGPQTPGLCFQGLEQDHETYSQGVKNTGLCVSWVFSEPLNSVWDASACIEEMTANREHKTIKLFCFSGLLRIQNGLYLGPESFGYKISVVGVLAKTPQRDHWLHGADGLFCCWFHLGLPNLLGC